MDANLNESRLGRRKLLGLAAAGAGVASLALAGCGSDDDGNTSGTSSGSSSPAAGGAQTSQARTVNITYWGSFSGNLGDAEKAVVDRFNQSQGEVAVNYQFQGTYEETAQKLTAALASGTTPDVSLLSDVWWFKFYLAGALAPLDQLFDELKVDKKDYEPSLSRSQCWRGPV
jgi:sn-glycerol 3-phosphate transport system substrate-binding protein